MNWERVHLIYYVYTSITVIVMILALGKFFCVRKLYEVYETLNRTMDYTLGVIIAFIVGISIVAWFSLFFMWKGMILICCVIMTMFGGVCLIWMTILSIHYCYICLRDYHYRLKHRKNL